MDNHERSTLEQILAMLHGLIGRDDAKDDFRPDLSFVSDRILRERKRLFFRHGYLPSRKMKKDLRLPPKEQKKKSPTKIGGKVVF